MSVSSTALKRRQDIIVPENTKTNSITISSGATTGYVLFSSDNLGNSQWINPESVSGLSGSSGTSGKSGSSGINGTSGISGASGSSGSSGKGFTTINNPVNNRVLTSLGTDDTANAEQNLTFDGNTLTLFGSGGTVMDIQGISGQLFSINDSLVGDLLVVSDISGIPILTVDSDSVVTVDGNLFINSFLYSGITSGSTVISTVSMNKASAAFFDYWIQDGSNMRAGTVMSVWTNDTAQYTDHSTNDIGSTLPLTFTIGLNTGNIQLTAVITSGTWIIKTAIRLL